MLDDLKELERFFKLCRKQGVLNITYQGISVKFGDILVKASSQHDDDEIQTDGLTPDELMYYAIENAGHV